ncbi:hypothetical protein PENTCL1PPCAC_10578, partial [Pristionchus entomophagus]
LLALAVIALTASTPIHANEAVCKGLTDGSKLTFAEDMRASHSVEAGGRLELKCSVLAAPTADIVWFHNGNEVEIQEGPKDHLISSGKRMGISILESRLVRECVSAEDAGTYSCVALSPCSKTIKQSVNVVLAGKGVPSCNPSSEPTISLHTYSRMELPTVPVQLVCRSSHSPLSRVRWERVADDDTTMPISYAASGFLQLPSGDLLVDPQTLSAEDGEELVTLTMRCHVGSSHVDSSIIFMEEEE